MTESERPALSTVPAPRFPIVGIGASAGGLDAFLQLLGALPADTGMAFVLVQHLAPSHPSALAEILSRATVMPVTEVHAALPVEPNHVYVIPPGQSMLIEQGTLQLSPREGRGPHHPIDHFFRALALDRRHQALGVVLSGTATDGTLGLEAIKAEGGITFAQDASAQHDGMPNSAVHSGCVDFVRSPVAIAEELTRIARHPHGLTVDSSLEPHDQVAFAQILELLRQATGVDFADYKCSTLRRRIARRMVSTKLSTLAAYAEHLRRTPSEQQVLYQDILINVTSFFRDPAAFAAMSSSVFPRLLSDPTLRDPVRIWVVGCSTGQEAYSLAIAFTEVAEAAGSRATLQVFATDVNARSIDKARIGIYGREIATEMSPERLHRFFTEVEDGYRICRNIREACVFSRHDVLADPPFSRIDLVSCRNVLIYMDPQLQQRILPLLHYALRPEGCLWLGSSETIGSSRDLFDELVGPQRIFTKRLGSEPAPRQNPRQHLGPQRSLYQPVAARDRDASDLPREAERVLLGRYAPPGVVISSDLEIRRYLGDIGPFLAPATGKASLSLLKMLREGLVLGVRTALRRASEAQASTREVGLRVKTNGAMLDVAVEVIPLRGQGESLDGGFLVLFETSSTSTNPAVTPPAEPTSNVTDTSKLEQELAATRDYLQSVIEQHERANEDLQSASEEVQSANEELQSTNEELETSKEEVQSSNEELATVNDELNNRNAALQRTNDDLHNLFDSVRMVVVMLDLELRVRRFTPKAEQLLNLRSGDVGRRLAELNLNLESVPDLEPLLAEVRDSGTDKEYEVKDKRGHWHALRLRPYRTLANIIDGVIVILVDIDLIKRTHAFTESIVATVHEPLLVLDRHLRVRSASQAFYQTFHATPVTTLGEPLYELGDSQWDIADLRGLLGKVLERGEHFNDFAVTSRFPSLGQRTMLLNARRLVQVEAESPSILLAIEDVTERKAREEALQLSEIRFRRLFETSQDGIMILDAASGEITQVNPLLTSLLKFPREHFLGKELWQIGFLGDREASTQAMKHIAEHGSLRFEHLPLVDVEGNIHPVEMVASMHTEGEQQVIQCNIRDISDRSQLEAKLRQQAAKLSDLDRRKDEFLAMLSHELRSPLAPIANAVRLLARESATENAVQSQARAIVERQLRHLQHLVDDLLEVSRITTGRLLLRQEFVSAIEIANGAIETVRPLVEQHHHRLTISLSAEPLLLYADPTRLEQVVTNLLTNAVKYTEAGGQIHLSLQREGDTCVLRVKDSGVGIAPTLLPHIFELFSQGHRSLDRSEGGLGIGLALVARLTELHGGTVTVDSVVGLGSEFVVRLPLHRETDAPQPIAPPKTPSPQSLRILVVDDNTDTASSFQLLLESSGHTVRTEADGITAIRTALEFRPDVVLLDIGLVGLNGYEVARHLRREPGLGRPLLIATTGYGQETDRAQALQAGFDEHLVKPVNFEKLENLLLAVVPRP